MKNKTKNNSQLKKGDGLSLPKSWEIKKLGEVCEIYQPKTISKKKMVINGKYPVFGANGIIGRYNEYNHELPKLLVTCRGATCGSVNISLPKSWINGNAMVINPVKGDLLLKFVEYFFRGYIDLSNIITGAAQPQITRQNLSPVPIPIPPLPEQKRIVAILDRAFEAINKAKANAEQNLKNVKELFQSKLQTIFDNGQLKIDNGEWEEKKLGEIVDFFNGFAFKSKNAIDFSNTQVLRMGNLYQNKLNLNRKPAFYPEHFAIDYEKYLLKENDLIISLTGTTGKEDYGYTVKIPKTERNLLLNQRIAKIIIKNKDVIKIDFLFQYLLSRTFLDELYQTANGTRQANLSTETMKELKILYPPIQEQKQIVSQLDKLQVETKKLEAIYQKKIDDLEELKKSILQKAFSGQLTMDNGELKIENE